MLKEADGLYLTDYTDCLTGFCELLLSPYSCHTTPVVSTRCSVQMIRLLLRRGRCEKGVDVRRGRCEKGVDVRRGRCEKGVDVRRGRCEKGVDVRRG